MTDDVLGDNDGIVDDQTDGNRHRAERHQVERLADQIHGEDADGQRQRNRGGADRGNTGVMEEQQQDDHRQYRPDDHRVAHGFHRVAHEGALIVNRLQCHSRRQRRLHRAG